MGWAGKGILGGRIAARRRCGDVAGGCDVATVWQSGTGLKLCTVGVLQSGLGLRVDVVGVAAGSGCSFLGGVRRTALPDGHELELVARAGAR